VNIRRAVTRRGFLAGAGAVAAGGTVAGVVGAESSGSAQPQIPEVALGEQPAGLPVSQHAWIATLSRDADGNPVAPRFDRLLLFDVNGTPTARHVRLLEAALRTLERSYRWGPSGLLFTAGWGPEYFERLLRLPSPVPAAKALSDFEPATVGESYHLCLHLACDDESRLADVEAALLHGERPAGAAVGQLQITDALRWRETRTGFTGAGLPAAHQHVGGIPSGNPVPTSAPLYMGFKSNLKRNQATEEAVTIPGGPFAAGTTMVVSYMRLRLSDWYTNLNERERVALMYSPQTTPADVARLTTDAESEPDKLNAAIHKYGVIGHAQTSARARRHGKPLILRRDFDTDDGGQAGLHFVALQRTIEDFVKTRNAMNAADAQLQNPEITDTINNGINEFMFVLKRSNFVLPSRAQRSFPLLPGRETAL
jgi:hypothetical protein